jgi:hypothetical protein
VNVMTSVVPNNINVQNVALQAAAVSTVTFHVTVPEATPAGAVRRVSMAILIGWAPSSQVVALFQSLVINERINH